VNLLTKTEEFNDSAWTKTNATVTADAIVAPNGTTTADALFDNTTTNFHGVQIAALTTQPAGTYVASIYVKPNGRTWIQLVGISGNDFNCFFNLVGSGGVGTAAAGTTGSIEALENGWYRCSVIKTFASTTVFGSYRVFTAIDGSGSGSSYTGDGTSGIFIWGADLRVTNDGVGIPEYQRVNTATDYDTAGFPMYLRFDGSDDFMQTNSIDFTATDKMTVFAGVRKFNPIGTSSAVFEHTIGGGQISLFAPSAAGEFNYVGQSALDALTTNPQYAAPFSAVLSGRTDRAVSNSILRVNGVLVASATGVPVNNYLNAALFIGRRAGTSLPFNGRLTQLIIRGAQTSDPLIASTEAFVNSKTKAF
jgi:hypothetical protein